MSQCPRQWEERTCDSFGKVSHPWQVTDLIEFKSCDVNPPDGDSGRSVHVTVFVRCPTHSKLFDRIPDGDRGRVTERFS